MVITNHLIFSTAGIYVPTVCSHAILWLRAPDDGCPVVGVHIESPARAQLIADVHVVGEDGIVIRQLAQRREGSN